MEVGRAAADRLAALLQTRTGQQLTTARRWRIAAVLEPLARARGLPSVDALVADFPNDPLLAEQAVEALLNNETFFYRDRGLFALLLGPALDRLRTLRAPERRLSVWCAGCSTGQEAYSIAIHFAERRMLWSGWRIDILATDISAAAVDQARSGAYSQFEVQRGLAVTQMIRWFGEEPGGMWRIAPALRDAVRFERRSVLGPPPGRFDMILCRNVLLYFPPATRDAAQARLAAAAAPGAVLMLGAGETLPRRRDGFAADPECRGLYLRSAEARPPLGAAS